MPVQSDGVHTAPDGIVAEPAPTGPVPESKRVCPEWQYPSTWGAPDLTKTPRRPQRLASQTF